MQLGGTAQQARNWASLNPDILQVVFCNLSSPATPGTVHVTETCRSWRIAASGVRGQQAQICQLSSSRCDSFCRWITKYAPTLVDLRFSSRSSSKSSSRRIRRVIAALMAAAKDAAAAGEPLPLQQLWCPTPLQQLAHLLPLLPSLQACGPVDVVGRADRWEECNVTGSSTSTSTSSSDGSSLDRHDICSNSPISRLGHGCHKENVHGTGSSSSSSSKGGSYQRLCRAGAATTHLEALQACSHLQQLHLNLAPTCSCQPEADACSCWQQVMEALPAHLVQLRLHGPVQLDLCSLNPHTQLEQLELHLYDIQDYTPLLNLPRLQRLAVGLTSHEHVSRLVPVQHLVKELTGPVGGDLQIPAELTALTSLVLFGSHVVPPNSICQQLEALSLAVYWPQGVEAMGRLLQQHSLFPRLRHLELRTEQGAQHLITALHHLTQLTSLNLHLTAASSTGQVPKWSGRWAGALRELKQLRRLSVPAQLMETEAPWLTQLQQLEQLTVAGNLVTAAQLCTGASEPLKQQEQQQKQQQQPWVRQQQQQAGQSADPSVTMNGLQGKEEVAGAGLDCWLGWPLWWTQGQAAISSAGQPARSEQQPRSQPQSTVDGQQHLPPMGNRQGAAGAGAKRGSSAAAAAAAAAGSDGVSSSSHQPLAGGNVCCGAARAPSASYHPAPALRVLRVEGRVAPDVLVALQLLLRGVVCEAMGV